MLKFQLLPNGGYVIENDAGHTIMIHDIVEGIKVQNLTTNPTTYSPVKRNSGDHSIMVFSDNKPKNFWKEYEAGV